MCVERSLNSLVSEEWVPCILQLRWEQWKYVGSNKIVTEKVGTTHCTVVELTQLKIFWHIWRTKDKQLVKNMMWRMIEGDWPHIRLARRWSSDITYWCGCTLSYVHQRHTWCGCTLSYVHQRHTWCGCTLSYVHWRHTWCGCTLSYVHWRHTWCGCTLSYVHQRHTWCGCTLSYVHWRHTWCGCTLSYVHQRHTCSRLCCTTEMILARFRRGIQMHQLTYLHCQRLSNWH